MYAELEVWSFRIDQSLLLNALTELFTLYFLRSLKVTREMKYIRTARELEAKSELINSVWGVA